MDIQALRKEAQETMGFTDAQADAFVDGFIKEAAVGFDNAAGGGGGHGKSDGDKPAWNAVSTVHHGVVESFAKAMGGSISNIAVNGLVSGIAGLVGSATNSLLYRKFTESLKTVVETNRIVRNADRNKVMSYAETIYKFAPHVASDVNLLSQLLANAIHGEGVDPSTIETITRLEERQSNNRGFQPQTFTR